MSSNHGCRPLCSSCATWVLKLHPCGADRAGNLLTSSQVSQCRRSESAKRGIQTAKMFLNWPDSPLPGQRLKKPHSMS